MVITSAVPSLVRQMLASTQRWLPSSIARPFSLALFFFLMSAVEQRIPRWLHLTGLATLITGFLAFGHLGGESSRVQGGSLFMVYAILLCLFLFPAFNLQTFKHIRFLDCPAWLLGSVGFSSRF